MNTRTMRYLRTMAEVAGLELERVERGKHYKMTVRAPNGSAMMFVMSVTPSDRRGHQNAMARLRRFAAANREPNA